MERLTRLCQDTENGTYSPYTAGDYNGIYPNCTLGKVVKRLAYYEDLEENGRLIILDAEDACPCGNCTVGWISISSEGTHGCEETCVRLKQYNEKYSI